MSPITLSLKEKYTVNPRQFYSTATRKVPENPKRPKPFVHTFNCPFTHESDWGELYLKKTRDRNGMCCEKTWKCYLYYMTTGSHNISLTQRCMSPAGEKIHWRGRSLSSPGKPCRYKSYRVLLYRSAWGPESKKEIHPSNISTSTISAVSWRVRRPTI